MSEQDDNKPLRSLSCQPCINRLYMNLLEISLFMNIFELSFASYLDLTGGTPTEQLA